MQKTNSKSRQIVTLIVAAAVLLIIPFLLPNAYITQIVNMIGIYIILGTSINILTGYTGQLSLGQAAFFGIGAYTYSNLKYAYWMPFLDLSVASAVVAGIFGLILAVPALKVKGSYLALLTMGFGEVVRIVMVNWSDVTNGTAGIVSIESPSVFGFSLDDQNVYYYLILLFVIAGILYQRALVKSRTGRAFVAIREDVDAAELCGINVTSYKIRAFVLSAVYCGIAGTLYAMMIHYVSPDTFTNNTSSIILWTAIVGGFGTIAGPVLGGVVMQVLPWRFFDSLETGVW